MIPLPDDQAAAWSALRQRFPWPAIRPPVGPVEWAMDYGGRDLIVDVLCNRPRRIVLEIGVFLGGSVRQWLRAGADVVVVAIDPWADLVRRPPHGTFVERHPLGRRHGDQLFAPGGLYDTFISTTWPWRDRVVPVRGRGTDVLPILHELGLRPDLVYVDADKQGNELTLCERFFPTALIGGDDWMWQDGSTFPIRGPASETARRQGRVLKHVDNTWLIDDRPWSWRQRRAWVERLPWAVWHRCSAAVQRRAGRTSSGQPVRAAP